MKFLPILSALLLLPASAPGQRVVGRVLESGTDKPVPNVEVRLNGAGGMITRAITDSLGRFLLRANNSGQFQLRTNHISFAAVSAPVQLGPDEQLELIVHVSVAPIDLPALIIVARGRAPDAYLERSGFYERKAEGFGVFRTPEDITRRRPLTTSDLFQGTSGVRVTYAGIRGKDIVMTRGEDPNCRPRVFVDNVIVRRGGRTGNADDPPIDLLIQPQDIAGIEIYRSPSETPRQFAANDVTCGVVLFWSKRPSVR